MAFETKILVKRLEDGTRSVEVPVDAPVLFGYHGGIAEHYGHQPGTFEPHASAIDYLVASIGGCLTGVLSAQLEGREIATKGKLDAEVTGTVEKADDGVAVVKSVHVAYTLRVDALDDRKQKKIDMCMQMHKGKCPVSRSIAGSIDVTTEMRAVEVVEAAG